MPSPEIEELAEAMAHPSSPPQYIDAGYTYLGQFIAHELVPATNPPTGRGRPVTALLDLDSLYDHVPDTVPLDEKGRFRMRFVNGVPVDLIRRQGEALIPEHRNDDNVIVSQLHLLWQRLHNFTIDECGADAAEARRLLTLLFQLIVVEDYLKQVLMPSVFESYFRRDERWLGLPPDSIPPEFSRAAFRFGHSMVRATYEGFPHPDVDLQNLFQPNTELPPQLIIDWKVFFGLRESGNGAQDATRIDPFVTPAMRHVRPLTPGAPTVDIIIKNLEAGAHARLRPGHAYVDDYLKSANGEQLQSLGLQFVGEIWPDLRQRLRPQTTIRIENLPLWPYVLNEAILLAKGRHLGPLGSLICAEVLANSIKRTSPSIFRSGWLTVDPPLGQLGRRLRAVPSFKDSGEGFRALRMRHIVDLLNP